MFSSTGTTAGALLHIVKPCNEDTVFIFLLLLNTTVQAVLILRGVFRWPGVIATPLQSCDQRRHLTVILHITTDMEAAELTDSTVDTHLYLTVTSC